MKLYATVTSERAKTTAKKGGNEFIEINLFAGNNKEYFIIYSKDGHLEIIDALNDRATIFSTKGKKQKDEIDCGCEKDVFTCYKHRK